MPSKAATSSRKPRPRKPYWRCGRSSLDRRRTSAAEYAFLGIKRRRPARPTACLRESAMVSTILIVILIIALMVGLSGRLGGYGFGYGHSGMGLIGVILVVILVLKLLHKI
jgi:hypothetical protein